MSLIDDKGRLFGTINIIDALVVLLVLAVAAAGAAFVLGTDDQPTSQPNDLPRNTTTIATLEIAGVQPYVANAIPEGPIATDRVAAVENKSTRPTEVIVRDQNGDLHERTHPRKQTVTLHVALNTTTTDDDTLFGGNPLEIGRQLTLDLGDVTVKGTVTGLPDR